ncbi:hypothetical protein ONZ45_g3333 [Pleurotus djamor]|nr:hypothetical protein ONZ45_g3333 [Pleurotus djamor]
MTTPKLASAPFDGPNADLILRSSDDVDFHVHKILLLMASPFFGKNPETNQPLGDSTGTNNLPLISVRENSSTLDSLLRYCYPVTDPIINDISTLHNVLKAASNLNMSTVTARMENSYQALAMTEIKDFPAKAYALACHHKWGVVARQAAEASLLFKADELLTQFASVNLLPDAKDFHQLFQYHMKFRVAIQSIPQSAQKDIQNNQAWDHDCASVRFAAQHFPLSWKQYFNKIGDDAVNGAPLKVARNASSYLPPRVEEKPECRSCQRLNDRLSEKINIMDDYIEKRSEELLREVPLRSTVRL